MFDKLRFIALKGSGYFCNIKKYIHIETNSYYAVKTLKKEHWNNGDYVDRFKKEIELLESLQPKESIVKLVQYNIDCEPKDMYYIMPYADSNLYKYIRSHNNTLSIDERYKITDQVIDALKFAHYKNIKHRDISPTNVLVYNDDCNSIKVCDFGLSKDEKSLSQYTTSSISGYGQILYVAPEQKEKLKSATIKSDIFSLGKLIYFVFTGKDPIDIRDFELSALVRKATAENPDDRFDNIEQFEEHYLSTKKIHTSTDIPIEYQNLNDIANSIGTIDWIRFHELFKLGQYSKHPYDDYISPVVKILNNDIRLDNYYKVIGNGIIDSIQKFIERLDDLNSNWGWPFSEMNNFGLLLGRIIRRVNINYVRLLCIQKMWDLAFRADQWGVQKQIMPFLTDKFLTNDIVIQFAEYVKNNIYDRDLSFFSDITLPNPVKIAIIEANQ